MDRQKEFSSSVLFTWPFSVSRKASQKDSSAIYDIYLDVQEMWTYWLSQNLKMK